MNQRIINALNAAGKTPVDVTRTMETIFGSIPNECRAGATIPPDLTPPTAPVSLGVDVTY
jgi:hypothetical protein